MSHNSQIFQASLKVFLQTVGPCDMSSVLAFNNFLKGIFLMALTGKKPLRYTFFTSIHQVNPAVYDTFCSLFCLKRWSSVTNAGGCLESSCPSLLSTRPSSHFERSDDCWTANIQSSAPTHYGFIYFLWFRSWKCCDGQTTTHARGFIQFSLPDNCFRVKQKEMITVKKNKIPVAVKLF